MSVEAKMIGYDIYARLTTRADFNAWIDGWWENEAEFCKIVGIESFDEIKGKWFTVINNRLFVGLPEREVYNERMIDNSARRGTPKRENNLQRWDRIKLESKFKGTNPYAQLYTEIKTKRNIRNLTEHEKEMFRTRRKKK